MAFIKDAYTLLSEAALLESDTEAIVTENEIMQRLNDIEEVSEEVVITAEMVSVISVGEDYLVEINNLVPYMKSNGITSVAEALDNISEANNLEAKAVGLLMESDEETKKLVDNAKTKANKNKLLDKIKKSTDLSDNLKKNGYKVKKKKCKK